MTTQESATELNPTAIPSNKGGFPAWLTLAVFTAAAAFWAGFAHDWLTDPETQLKTTLSNQRTQEAFVFYAKTLEDADRPALVATFSFKVDAERVLGDKAPSGEGEIVGRITYPMDARSIPLLPAQIRNDAAVLLSGCERIESPCEYLRTEQPSTSIITDVMRTHGVWGLSAFDPLLVLIIPALFLLGAAGNLFATMRTRESSERYHVRCILMSAATALMTWAVMGLQGMFFGSI